ncbi:Flp pilus assembly protein, ATPase CpaF [Cryptosporangium arvum DSM 44712]|uniref:Flp pilus assembly protein, ATPase CpaF n=1 Tax=Cryptosporangium arvum DSM 44712 TaxID=927661 RepID=A0A011AD78_9ACTN|nr:ATPase, T2SS/T4P/T4SS family [Cryptosporangium arvum]EXG80011.1 Flp pilus assembly protein, ATPase CpaF [Cryptosporangium arvum DSM 44712]
MESVEQRVRDLVRRRGVDPMGDPAAVGLLIDEVLATSPLVPSETRQAVLDAVAGLGPLQRFLDDPTVEEIWVNGPGRVFVARGGRSELTTTILAAGQVEELVQRALEHSGRRVDLSTPFVDAMLSDGSRLHVVIPDVTREHWAINIRKFVARAHSLVEAVALGTLTPHAAGFLEASVVAGVNVIVSGGTQAGKTTLLV